ncbi:MAG: hypothetical protein IGQ88_06960 [Gloeomargaritaceae cyanobacterium C42_A2020_066]|nr:hypothetical protein [Gloeomargaritaceae cyanobacterium C42_A2020_066]
MRSERFEDIQAYDIDALFKREASSFRDERVKEISEEKLTIPFSRSGKIILLLVPMEALAQPKNYEMEELKTCINKIQLVESRQAMISQESLDTRIMLDGVICYRTDANYTKIYRNGIIETVHSLKFKDCEPNRRFLPSLDMEKYLLEVIDNDIRALRAMGVSGGIYCFISFVGVKGVKLGVEPNLKDPDSFAGQPLPNDIVLIPETIFNEDIEDITKNLRKSIDMIWNAFGFKKSLHFRNI